MQRSVRPGDAFAQAYQPEATVGSGGGLIYVESAAVVVDVEDGLVVEESQGAHHASGAGVFGDIRQRFLRGPKQDDLLFGC